MKQRTAINFVRNKMYPDSIWNKVMVGNNEKKFSTEDICKSIETMEKMKMNLDDLFICVSRLYTDERSEADEVVETARFVEQMKYISDGEPNISRKSSGKNKIKLE